MDGKYVYLCYRKQKVTSSVSKPQAVTDIKIIYNDNAVPGGCKKVQGPAGANINFNMGAKGAFVLGLLQSRRLFSGNCYSRYRCRSIEQSRRTASSWIYQG